MTETCKHSKADGDTGLCWGCKARRKAEYDLTGTHDPEEQKKYWDDVWKVVRELRRAKKMREFENRLKGKHW